MGTLERMKVGRREREKHEVGWMMRGEKESKGQTPTSTSLFLRIE